MIIGANKFCGNDRKYLKTKGPSCCFVLWQQALIPCWFCGSSETLLLCGSLYIFALRYLSKSPPSSALHLHREVKKMAQDKPKPTAGVWSTVKPFVNGGCSGMLATCVVQPIDMVKVTCFCISLIFY